ncbi:SDR family NAD(P)-dependent oxidoreductase [Virgibacillus halodenitrificans]|nr:SDR family NAD(P)-dependent oxidoreductase [Virgibacillus halodenitrificans]MEC2158499.1 SDR family NAD(P)-dependent oxidoreductase [Virgibacillus halodenitrificans]
MGRLTGKVALVTGAGTGLGRAIAISFAKAGATVILNGRREEKLHEVAKEIGGRLLHYTSRFDERI